MYKKEKNKLHFDEEQAYEAVSMMENEDGTTGPHWSVEDTTSVANQYGINLNSTNSMRFHFTTFHANVELIR